MAERFEVLLGGGRGVEEGDVGAVDLDVFEMRGNDQCAVRSRIGNIRGN